MNFPQLQQHHYYPIYPASVAVCPNTADYRMDPAIPYHMDPSALQVNFKIATSPMATSTPAVPSRPKAKSTPKPRPKTKAKSCKTTIPRLCCEGSGKKRFVCNFVDCGKVFSRSEHLHRHGLNHKEGDYTCERCLAHFRRRDLLDRHIARHKGKDDEAGGVGLGVLATRKRLWRNSEGKIVNSRRPSFAQNFMKRQQVSYTEKVEATIAKLEMAESTKFVAPTISPILELQTPISPLTMDTHVMEIFGEREHEEPQPDTMWLDVESLPSPATSEMDLVEARHGDASLDHLHTIYEDPWQLTSPHTLPDTISHNPQMTRHPEYQKNTPWGIQPFQAHMGAFGDVTSDETQRLDNGQFEWPPWNQELSISKFRDYKR